MSAKIHTHYDNLRISRDAPDEVIKAAYRALSQKYHPDKNPDADAARVMAILNNSYAILSDPQQRRKHDSWIAAQEKTARPSPPRPQRNASDARNESKVHQQARAEAEARAEAKAQAQQRDKPYAHTNNYAMEPEPDIRPVWEKYHFELTRRKIAFGVCGLFVLIALIIALLHDQPSLAPVPASELRGLRAEVDDRPPAKKPAKSIATEDKADDAAPVTPTLPDPAVATIDPKKADLNEWQAREQADVDVISADTPKVKFALGPDGLPWPLGPKIYNRDDGVATGGESSITIDNSRNPHAMHVKLATQKQPRLIEGEMYVPAHRLLTLENLQAGIYLLKVRDLQSGFAMQSQPVMLEAPRIDPPVQYGMLEVTLYGTPAENAGFRVIPDNEF